MTKLLLAAIAALTVASAVTTTAAEAKSGCGKGWFFDGSQCVPKAPKGERGFRAVDPGFRNRGGIDRHGDRSSSFDRRGGDRWSSNDHHGGDRYDNRGHRGGALSVVGMRVHVGDGKPKFSFDH